MFNVGQKVVCIDDTWQSWVFDLYRQLPKKGKTYTIRSISSGRSAPKFGLTEEADLKIEEAQFDIMVRLVELVNPDDPHSSVRQELGFRAERFRSLETMAERESKKVSEPLKVTSVPVKGTPRKLIVKESNGPSF